jgi:hypothetical protein
VTLIEPTPTGDGHRQGETPVPGGWHERLAGAESPRPAARSAGGVRGDGRLGWESAVVVLVPRGGGQELLLHGRRGGAQGALELATVAALTQLVGDAAGHDLLLSDERLIQVRIYRHNLRKQIAMPEYG